MREVRMSKFFWRWQCSLCSVFCSFVSCSVFKLRPNYSQEQNIYSFLYVQTKSTPLSLSYSFFLLSLNAFSYPCIQKNNCIITFFFILDVQKNKNHHQDTSKRNAPFDRYKRSLESVIRCFLCISLPLYLIKTYVSVTLKHQFEKKKVSPANIWQIWRRSGFAALAHPSFSL